jgi:hypothetical protein
MAYFFYVGLVGKAIKKPVTDRPGFWTGMCSGSPDNAQDQGDQGQYNQNMDQTANAIYENAQKPSDQ